MNAKRKNAGFTLIEVMVSTAIMGFVIYLAFLSQSLFIDMWHSRKTLGKNALDTYRAHVLIRNAVESVCDYSVTDPESERNGIYYPFFQGKIDSVVFVTLSSVFGKEIPAVGRLKLQSGADMDLPDLVYEEAPLDQFYVRYANDDIPYSRKLTIAKGVSACRFRYYGVWEIKWNPELDYFETIKRWQDEYSGKDRNWTPEKIEINISGKDGEKRLSFSIKGHNPYKDFFFNELRQKD